MDLQEILKRFSTIANLSWDEAAHWATICEDSYSEIKNHLRDGVDENEHSRRLNVAAAALAFYKYVSYRASGGGMESFTAGEIRIKTNVEANIKIAYSVWKDAKMAISDLLKDDNFVFERIV